MSNKSLIQESLSTIKKENLAIGEAIKQHLLEAKIAYKFKKVDCGMGSIDFTSYHKDLKGRDLSVSLFDLDKFFQGLELTLPSIEAHIAKTITNIKEEIQECTHPDDLDVLKVRLDRALLMGNVAIGVFELYQAFSSFKNPSQQITDYCPRFNEG